MKVFSKITLAVATAALLSAVPLAQAEARPHDHHGGWSHGGGHHGGWRDGRRGGHDGWHRGRGNNGYYGAAFGLGALTGALINRPYYAPQRYTYPRTVHYAPAYYPPSRTVVIYR